MEIYPGFAAAEILYHEDGGVAGIATRDVGIAKDGTLKDSYERGCELRARQTLFAEGCRGSCSESLMKKFDMRADAQPQTYAMGLKEVWELPEEMIKPGCPPCRCARARAPPPPTYTPRVALDSPTRAQPGSAHARLAATVEDPRQELRRRFLISHGPEQDSARIGHRSRLRESLHQPVRYLAHEGEYLFCF